MTITSVDFFLRWKYTLFMHFSKKDILTIPNIMTYFRILLVPAFCVVYLNAQSIKGHIWSIAIVAASAVTDVFDGIVARKTGQVTDLGKILDPVADKAIEFAMLFCVVVRYRKVTWLIIIFAVKELVSLAFSGYLFLNDKNIGGAIWAGKICTVVLYAALLAFIVLPEVSSRAEIIIVLITGAFMVLAFVVYMSAYIKLLIQLRKERRKEAEEEEIAEIQEI